MTLVQSMKLVGWTFIEECLPWTKVFDVDVSYDSRFSFVPIEDMEKAFVNCDLQQCVKLMTLDFTNMLDSMFSTFGLNIKDALSERDRVTYNGKSVKCIDDKFNNKELGIAEFRQSADASITVIDGRYIYFNCTSYMFWKPIVDFLGREFETINLGGRLIKIGAYEEIDKFLKEVL